MDWKAVDFNWNRARAFLVTAQEGSFSAAARALGSTQPTVGRQVAALEEELGLALFERVGSHLELTPAGLDLAEQVQAMAEAATQVSLVAAGRSQAVEGTVRVTASELISAHLLGPALRALRQAHPGIHIEIVASNQAQDLQRRAADIAVRNFIPTQEPLFIRRLPDRFARLYGSHGALDALCKGGPNRPEQLAKADLFGFADVDRMLSWCHSVGLPLTRANFPIVTENHLVQWELCKAGLGLCFVLEEVGDAEPAVRRALPQLPPMPVPMVLTCHQELRTSRRIRVVFDQLVETLGGPTATGTG